MPASIGTEELRALVVIARSKDLSQAAKELEVSKRNLTQFAHKFEQRIGVPLFVWSRRRVELTTSGAVLVERANLVLELMRQAIEQMNVSSDFLRHLIIPPPLPMPEVPLRRAKRQTKFPVGG
jgi:LysR family transcriptional regulator, nitrogen assimilation regulatory protein